MKIILPFLLLLLAPLAQAGALDEQLKAQGFREQMRKERGGITSTQAGMPSYSVSIKNAHLVLSQERERPNGLVTRFKTTAYNYSAFDGGEWGGGLEAVNAKGEKFKLTKQNVIGLFSADGKLYALTGLAHMSLNFGALYRIDEEGPSPKLSLITRLTGAPRDVVVDDQTLYILTDNDLAYLHIFGETVSFHIIVHDGVWDSLSTGMVKLGNQVAIGMHAGVVIIDLNRWEGRNASYRYYAK